MPSSARVWIKYDILKSITRFNSLLHRFYAKFWSKFFFCNGRNVWHSEKLSYSIVISFVILTNLITEQHSVWEQDMEKIYIFWVVKLLPSDKKIFFCSNKEEQCKPFARFIVVHDSKMHSCFKRETSSYLVKIVIIWEDNDLHVYRILIMK